MKRIIRDRRLLPSEAVTYNGVRAAIAEEIPELLARQKERMVIIEPWRVLVAELEAYRTAKGLSLSDVAATTGLDADRLLGRGHAPTIDELTRYACAVGKRLVIAD